MDGWMNQPVSILVRMKSNQTDLLIVGSRWCSWGRDNPGNKHPTGMKLAYGLSAGPWHATDVCKLCQHLRTSIIYLLSVDWMFSVSRLWSPCFGPASDPHVHQTNPSLYASADPSAGNMNLQKTLRILHPFKLSVFVSSSCLSSSVNHPLRNIRLGLWLSQGHLHLHHHQQQLLPIFRITFSSLTLLLYFCGFTIS